MQGAKNGFYGINLHYLEPRFRALFFDILVDFNIKDEIFDDNTRFRKLTYERLNTNRLARAFKPCFKHYLRGRIKTNLIMVPPKYWEMALFLPTDNFQKASRQTVWRDSRDQFRKS